MGRRDLPKIFGSRSFSMTEDQFKKGASIVRPPLSSSEGGERDDKSHWNDEQGSKGIPEEMIQSLQSIFCKGHYRS
jgi:hypothetical protein